MRVLGFSKKWSKLYQPEFTTFRFPRKDSDKGRDWKVGEQVQIVYHPRNKDREYLFNAEIINKEQRSFTPSSRYWNPPILEITDKEAIEDGFSSYSEMYSWMEKSHKTTFNHPLTENTLNKLTLRRVE